MHRTTDTSNADHTNANFRFVQLVFLSFYSGKKPGTYYTAVPQSPFLFLSSFYPLYGGKESELASPNQGQLNADTAQYPSPTGVIDVSVGHATLSITHPGGVNADLLGDLETALLNLFSGVIAPSFSSMVSTTLNQKINDFVISFALPLFSGSSGATSLPTGVNLSMRSLVVGTAGQILGIHFIPAIGCFGPLSSRFNPTSSQPPPPPPPLAALVVGVNPAPEPGIRQNYTFTVTNKATGSPVANAHVLLKCASGELQATTEANGTALFQQVNLADQITVIAGGKEPPHPVSTPASYTVTAPGFQPLSSDI